MRRFKKYFGYLWTEWQRNDLFKRIGWIVYIFTPHTFTFTFRSSDTTISEVAQMVIFSKAAFTWNTWRMDGLDFSFPIASHRNFLSKRYQKLSQNCFLKNCFQTVHWTAFSKIYFMNLLSKTASKRTQCSFKYWFRNCTRSTLKII